MRSLGASGIFEIFIPGLKEGVKYKFEIRTCTGDLKIKSDPFGYMSELRPSTASIVTQVDRYEWKDLDWMLKRKEMKESQPMLIYEVHLGSWKRKEDGSFLNYRDLAHELSNYCLDMGFTHIELMPILEHPFDESWGYQVTGFFAPTSRFGSPEDFQYFVDHLHRKGIGVILDWVPGHFPSDDFGLALFDGSALFEHGDPRKGMHPHWQTCIFNFGRYEVSNFLIASALFWLEVMHIDALRVDAVASMLYLDYGRNEGEWIPNEYGGRENLEAIEFIKHVNSIVHQRCPGAAMIAEESTAFPGISHPVDLGGLGFDMKWSMGWMNDTLSYFEKDPLFRHHHHNHLTFYLLYAFSERFVLVLSHDEVVHGKKSLIGKMPGDLWQKFAGLRLLYSYMICQPGKKLLFMGGEFAQWNEWYSQVSIEWDLLNFPYHAGVQQCVRSINHFYQEEKSLWAYDFDWRGFEWVDFNDYQNSVICYLRKSDDQVLLCIHNFTPVFHPHYRIQLRRVESAIEVFNTDDESFGGSGKGNTHIEIIQDSEGNRVALDLALSPLATQVIRVHFQS
jgi:1,4-alpha-glucan branching enzyme